ncbi:MAG: phosphate regulon transcriptional regulator PhoB [Gammaproteobacteria bacterium]|nr:phosphate regulon transcriptional regulator PhoB [Gammaproteobacteria bacterium]MBU1655328.1 phosphate regulon transcriptional regulator PhoB [Gammaproteobacteria bacterium]MBU1962261.1 phosphate regulon transcriptional regulator PhoB [Gammaproteobacteria bacterium]
MSDGLVLIVEDEDAIREMVRVTLETASFEVLDAADAGQAVRLLADHRPDIILMDWMLPGISGVDLTRRIRRDDALREIPIIMLTARGEENSKVVGLEAGVDDYVTKPFSTRELIARIKAVMRRSGAHQGEALEFAGGLTLDPARHRVRANGASLEIGPTEFRLLQFFMSHPERVYSRGQLLDQVWGRNVYIEERTVDVHIRRLRQALEPSGFDTLVQTVRGVGYRLSTQP